MISDSPLHRISARALLAIGLCCDVLVPILYYALSELSYTVSSDSGVLKLLELAMAVLFFGGVVGTTIGSGMWARQASNAAVAKAVAGVALLTLIYANLTRLGLDDPTIWVIPFGLLVVVFLVVGRVIGNVASNRNGLPR
jgi:hypothetical protein